MRGGALAARQPSDPGARGTGPHDRRPRRAQPRHDRRISNNDPAADYPAALVGLSGTVQTTRREIAADNFFTGIFETALDRTEIVTAVRLPKPQAACYMKFKNPASRYAIVGVFVARTAGGVRVAVTGAGPCVFRVPEMETVLTRSFTPDAIK